MYSNLATKVIAQPIGLEQSWHVTTVRQSDYLSEVAWVQAIVTV